jgi:hypothetical protein
MGKCRRDLQVTKVRAGSLRAAYETVRRENLDFNPVFVVVFRRGIRRRRERIQFNGGTWPDDRRRGEGGAGVREPRRPKPAPPHLSVELS